jgi:hypothetical protein
MTVSTAPAGVGFSGVKVLLSSDRRQLGPLATSSMRGGAQYAGVSFRKPPCYECAGIHDIKLERIDKIGHRFFAAALRRLVARSGRRAPNCGNVVGDPLWDRIADGGTPGAKGR